MIIVHMLLEDKYCNRLQMNFFREENNMTKAYSAKTIKTLEGMEHIRHRAGMYIGSVGENGLHHILLEIISNSVDEFLNGSGNHITVKLFEDGSVMVQDNARGIPHG